MPPTVPDLIYAWYERNAEDWRRDHLGASVIGDPCDRKLWYGYRWAIAGEITGRMLRLFETGHREEARIVQNLKDIGLKVLEISPKTGKQFRFTFHGGLFGGSADGIVLGVPGAEKTAHLLEIKTAKNTSYNKMVKHGLKKAEPGYLSQMQVLMKGLKLRRGLFVMEGKNTDDIYAERVDYDSKEADLQIERAKIAIESEGPTTRISEKPDFWKCKMCRFRVTCHNLQDEGSIVPLRNCRTCLSFTSGGKCELHGDRLLGEQKKGCPQHLYLPGLLHFWEPVDSSEDPRSVSYRLPDGRQLTDQNHSLTLEDGTPLDLTPSDPEPTAAEESV